jgi:hypothetical protein
MTPATPIATTDYEGVPVMAFAITTQAAGTGTVDHNRYDWYVRGADDTHYRDTAMLPMDCSMIESHSGHAPAQ